METPRAQPQRSVNLAGGIGRLRLVGPAQHVGWLTFGARRWRCAIGPMGVRARKREGDGATPRGRFRLQTVYYRADRGTRPRARLPIKPIRPDHGWCDQIGDRNYNRSIRLPYRGSHERLWRDDRVYDIVVSLDHNVRPRVQGRGSCVFLHVARAGYPPTAGCLALSRADLQQALAAGLRAIQTG